MLLPAVTEDDDDVDPSRRQDHPHLRGAAPEWTLEAVGLGGGVRSLNRTGEECGGGHVCSSDRQRSAYLNGTSPVRPGARR